MSATEAGIFYNFQLREDVIEELILSFFLFCFVSVTYCTYITYTHTYLAAQLWTDDPGLSKSGAGEPALGL